MTANQARRGSVSSGATALDDRHQGPHLESRMPPEAGSSGSGKADMAGLERSPSQLGGPVRKTQSTASKAYSKVTGVPPPNEKWDPEYEVKWDGPDDPENPYNWSPWKQWYAVVLGAFLVLNATLSSSAPSENIPSYMRVFGISEVAGTLTVSLFLCGYITGPLLWGPLSETFGRRLVFIISFFPYVCWNVGCALAPNFGSLLVFRFLGGTFAAAPLSNSGALVADVLPASTRGLGLSIFSLAPFAGPALGPIIGGFIEVSGTDWRWTYWVLTMFAGACLVVLVFTIPETYTPYLLQQKARRLRKETGNDNYWAPLDRRARTVKSLVYSCLVAPFKMLFEEPMLFAITLYLSFVYALVYMNFSSLPIIMAGVHGFSAGIVGLTFLPVFLGGVIGDLLYIFYFGPMYQRDIAKHAPNPVPPERRLPQCMVGAIALPISMFWLGWTGNYASISYWSPVFATGLLGMSILMVFLSLFNYLIDTYLATAATALAINTVVRSGFGAGFPLFTSAMYNRLGIQWASTLLGCLSLLGTAIPFILARYGPHLRSMSKNAPTKAPEPKRNDIETGKPNERPAAPTPRPGTGSTAATVEEKPKDEP